MKTHFKISERQSKAALLASTTAVLVLVLAGVLFAAELQAPGSPAVPSAPMTLTGSLHTLYGDAPDGSHMHTHMLVDDNGRATKLAVPDSVIAAAGGRTAINQRRVTVRGRTFSALTSSALTSAGSAAPPLEVENIAVDGSAPSSLPGASPLGAQALVSGSQKWVSILCRFADSAGVTPYQKPWFETLMLGGAAPGLDHYWREVSFGTVNLTGSVVVGWYNLPQPRSYYVYGNQLDTQRAANDCTQAADADVHFPSFIGINLMFNDDLDCCAWGGSTYLTRDGQSRLYRITWLPPWGYESQGPVAHEMGHGFGLPHSSGPYGATYDSRWDVMSDVWGNCPTHDPTYGCVGTHTISYHKDLLGWIPSNRRYVAALGTSQTITLEPLDQLASSGYMIARIPLPGVTTRFYTVETRRLAGYDAKLPGHAVIIHLVDTDRPDRDAQVVDPDANGNPDDAGGMWLPGEAFVDSANGISVSVLSATSQGFVVTVNNGSSAPPSVPDVTVSPLLLDFGNVAIGSKGQQTVTVRNDGPAALVLGTVTLGGLTPDQFVLVAASNLCGGRTLAAGEACTMLVRFKPKTSGIKDARLKIPSNDPDEALVKVVLRGTATSAVIASPEITVTPASVPFGNVSVGVKTIQVVTVKNEGAANLVLGANGLSTATGEISLAPGQDFCSGVTLAPGQSCTIWVKIKATSSGPKAATLSIPSNDADENVVSVAVTATAS